MTTLGYLFKLCYIDISTWPSGKLPFDCQKIDKNLTFKKKIAKIFNFFQKIANGNFLKKLKFLAIFWQSNGNFPEGQIVARSEVPGEAV